MSGYTKCFNDEIKCISVLKKDDELLEKHNKISDNVTNSFNKGFDCKPIYNKRYLKTKIKSMQFFMMMECQKKVLIF